MENYNKLVPLLKNKFSKAELKEVPGWRRKQSLQAPLEMKIESQIPAYINNRSDFNKTPVYPQWDLHSGTTYSPKGNIKSRKSFHYRVKSDHELLKQYSSRLTPIKENKTVYLKKLNTIEELIFDKFKKKVVENKEEKKVNKKLEQECFEKVNIPVVMYEFLVKERKDFEFRQSCDEEFFSKEGFRVSQDSAYTERPVWRDEICKDPQGSLKVGFKGDVDIIEVEEIKELEDKEPNEERLQKLESRNSQFVLKQKKTISNNKKNVPKELKLNNKKTEDKLKSLELYSKEVKIQSHQLSEGINVLNTQELNKDELSTTDNIKVTKTKKERKKEENKKNREKSNKSIVHSPEISKVVGKKGLKTVNIKFKNTKKNIFTPNPLKPKVHFAVPEEVRSEIQAKINQDSQNVEVRSEIQAKRSQDSQNVSLSKSPVSDQDNSHSNDPKKSSHFESQENLIEEPISPEIFKDLRKVKTLSSFKPNKKKVLITKKTIKFSENIIEQSDEIKEDDLIEYYNRNIDESLENEENLNRPILKADRKQFKRDQRRTKSYAVGFRKRKDSNTDQQINLNDKNFDYLYSESSISSIESQNNGSSPHKRSPIGLKKAKTALVQPLDTNISEPALIESHPEEDSIEIMSDNQSNYEIEELLNTEKRNYLSVQEKKSSDKLKNPEYVKSAYSKKQDSNIFARKNRKSQIVVSNVPQVKEEPLDNSKLLKITKTNRTGSNNLHPQYAGKYSKNQLQTKTKFSELSSLKSTSRNSFEKQSQQEPLKLEKHKDKPQFYQRSKKQDTSKLEDLQQRSLKSPMPPKQRNSIKFDLKETLTQKKSQKSSNLQQEKSKRRAKKRETYQSVQDSSENIESSLDSESPTILKNNRNLNTLQYELNLLEKMKKSSPLKQAGESNIVTNDDQVENNESGSSYDSGVDVEKEISDLIKTKHFSINNLAFSGPISFKFAQKMEVISGVNVNELEVNENTKDHRNQDYLIQKQRFLNWKKHKQLEFEYGLYSLQVKDLEEILPSERGRKYIRKNEQKIRNQQFFNSKTAFRHRDPNTFSGLTQEKKELIRKKTSFDQNLKTQSSLINPNISERVYFRIKNNKSLPSLHHPHSESAQDLLNSIKLNMQALEKVFEP